MLWSHTLESIIPTASFLCQRYMHRDEDICISAISAKGFFFKTQQLRQNVTAAGTLLGGRSSSSHEFLMSAFGQSGRQTWLFAVSVLKSFRKSLGRRNQPSKPSGTL